jgi:hypothetical protein
VKSFCYTCIGYNGVFCAREDCEKAHRGSGPDNPDAGDIHILSKFGEAFIQPKINARDISDDLTAEWLASRESVLEWTTKFRLVNSTEHSLVISSEEMEASEHLCDQFLFTVRNESLAATTIEESDCPFFDGQIEGIQ